MSIMCCNPEFESFRNGNASQNTLNIARIDKVSPTERASLRTGTDSKLSRVHGSIQKKDMIARKWNVEKAAKTKNGKPPVAPPDIAEYLQNPSTMIRSSL
mmetsp:Transcript_40401/g.64161  ORF Transcript_40401/g.64161 Transcript_40401/m.64161 type:complete len:100 (+) Transcript_40401:497-796(+)